MTSTKLKFAQAKPQTVTSIPAPPWVVLIVDDEKDIHAVTRFTLNEFKLDGRGIEFLSAYTGAEAIEIFRQRDDIAMCLLDVVMETEHAGLDVVRAVRKEQGNTLTRIVLRTGQPGQAPERRVIMEYDINGYKEKSEMTATRLFSTAYTMLSSYRDLHTLSQVRSALGKIFRMSRELPDLNKVQTVAHAPLAQLAALLHLDVTACVLTQGVDPESMRTLCWTSDDQPDLSADLRDELQTAAQQPANILQLPNGTFVAKALLDDNAQVLLHAKAARNLAHQDAELLQLFCENLASAIEKINYRTLLQAAH